MPQNPGQSPEIQAAIQRRIGQPGTPALQQQSPGAAQINPVPPPMPQGQMTQASGPAGPPAGEAPKMPRFEPQDRIDLISLALIEQMKNDSKLEKEKGKMARGETQIPPTPAPQAAPAPQAPMGGGSPNFSLSAGYEQPLPANQMQSNYGSGMGRDYSGMNGYGTGRF